MRQLFVIIVFSIAIGYLLGQAKELPVPYLNINATPADIKSYIHLLIAVALTTLVLTPNWKKVKSKAGRVKAGLPIGK